MRIRTFNQFISEGIQRVGDKFHFNWLTDSPDDVMPLKFKKYRGKEMKQGETTYQYYYAYDLEKSEYSTQLMKDLKMLETNPRDMDQIINKAVMGFDREFRISSYDTIITPQSSSLVLDRIAHALQKKGGIVDLFTDAFVKAQPSEIELDLEKVDNLPEKTKKEVYRAFSKATDPTKPFKMKEIFSAHRKFFKNFLKFNTTDDRRLFNGVVDKNIILIDDYRTSGITLKEMIRQLVELGAKKITVFIFIKLGGG